MAHWLVGTQAGERRVRVELEFGERDAVADAVVHAPTVTFPDRILTKPFVPVRRVNDITLGGIRMNRVKIRTAVALFTAAAALAVGMVQTADAKPPTHAPAVCAEPDGCTEMALSGL